MLCMFKPVPWKHTRGAQPLTLLDVRGLLGAGHNSRQQPIPSPLVGGALPVAHPAYSAPHALPDGGRGTPGSMRDVDPPRASASVGRRLSLFCPAEGRFYRCAPHTLYGHNVVNP